MPALGGGKGGVQAYLARLKAELTTAMILTGTAQASRVSSEIIRRQD